MTTPEQDKDFAIHGGDPVLMAKWQHVRAARERNKRNMELLASVGAGVDAASVIHTRMGLLMSKLLSTEQMIDFELEYEQMIEAQLEAGYTEARKAMLGSNLTPAQLAQVAAQLDKFRNGAGPPEQPGPGGLYRGRG